MFGRPKEFNQSFVDKATEYIKSCEDTDKLIPFGEGYKMQLKVKIPTIEGLAVFLGIHKDTIYQWEKENQDFSDVIGVLRATQADRLVNNGLSGAYNPTIAKVLLSKHGYREAVESESKTTIQDNRIDESKLTDDELRVIAELQRKSSTGKKAL